MSGSQKDQENNSSLANLELTPSTGSLKKGNTWDSTKLSGALQNLTSGTASSSAKRSDSRSKKPAAPLSASGKSPYISTSSKN